MVHRWETEAGLVPQRLSQSLTWHCHQKKQLWAPFPNHSFSQAQAVISASSLGWHVCLCSHRMDWSRALIKLLRAMPSHAGETLWWNTTTDILVPKLMLHEACRAVGTNSGCFEIHFILQSDNTGVMKRITLFSVSCFHTRSDRTHWGLVSLHARAALCTPWHFPHGETSEKRGNFVFCTSLNPQIWCQCSCCAATSNQPYRPNIYTYMLNVYIHWMFEMESQTQKAFSNDFH